MYKCVYGGERSASALTPQELSPLCFQTEFLTGLELTMWASERQGPACLLLQDKLTSLCPAFHKSSENTSGPVLVLQAFYWMSPSPASVCFFYVYSQRKCSPIIRGYQNPTPSSTVSGSYAQESVRKSHKIHEDMTSVIGSLIKGVSPSKPSLQVTSCLLGQVSPLWVKLSPDSFI